MYKYLILPLLLISLNASAQNHGGMKGRIVDSINRKPIEIATIAVLNARDTTISAMITYTQTDKEGLFALHTLPIGKPLKAIISFVGYKPQIKFFTLIKGQTLDMGTVQLSPRQLNEVIVTAEREPIVIKKDTFEFDASAFKVRPNAMVEDLLKKLPGVEVSNDGKITAMGKDVTKVLVDGKQFFASDPRIASQNLDADLIAKVQIYDDRENDPNHLIPDDQVKKIINLKFKKALKKSIFGKMYAGAGTDKHYQAGGLFNMFRDTLQVSMLGFTNNLNSTGFSYNELTQSAGINRGGSQTFGRGIGWGFAPVGKQTSTSAGININTDYGKKLKINLAYLLNHNQSISNSNIKRQQFISDTTATTGSTTNRNSSNYSHYLSGLVAWSPNDSTQLRYTPSLSINQTGADGINTSNSFSNFVNPINQSVSSNNSSGNNIQFQQNLSFNHKYKKEGPTLTIEHNLTLLPVHSQYYNNQDLTSYLSTFPSYSYRQLSDNQNKGTTASASVTYRYPINKKVILDAAISSQYSDELNKTSTYDYNPVTGEYDSFLLEKSNDLKRNTWAEGFNPGVTYDVIKKLRLVAHLNGQWQQINNDFNRNVSDISKHYFFVQPGASLTYKNLTLSYNRSVELPYISDMIPYTVVFSPSYSTTGNPDLKPTEKDNFSLNTYNYSYQKGTMFYISAGANFDHNIVVRRRTLNANLVETSMPINRGGRQSYHVNANFNKRFKKTKDVQFSLTSYGYFSMNQNIFLLNRQEGTQHAYYLMYTERASLNWKDKIEFDPSYSITRNYTIYSGVDYPNQNYVTHTIDSQFNIFWPKHMNLEGKYTYYYNPLVPDGFQKNSNLLTLGLARQFLKKDRGEIKLSCYDIFNQNVSINRYVSGNTVTDMQSQIIKRYFMLTLQFKFNKSSVK